MGASEERKRQRQIETERERERERVLREGLVFTRVWGPEQTGRHDCIERTHPQRAGPTMGFVI